MSSRPTASTRRLALEALLRVEDGAFAHILVPQTLRSSGLEPRDRALVTDLVYGTVRMQRLLDVVLSAVSKRPIGSLDPPVRAALRLGAYQLLIGAAVHPGTLGRGSLLLRHAGDLAALPAIIEGRATPQDQASQAVVAVLDPQPGDLVLDLASAPGGKATAAAERMGGDGLVVAADLHPGRVRTVLRAAERIGVRPTVATIVGDGRRPPVRDGAFDRVLLDAPCSGLGVLRRRPDARWRVLPGDVRDLAALQRVLLSAAAAAVKPRGRLVYA